MVAIRGVGAVCECPKNFLVLFMFQDIFADCKMPVGQGKDVDLSYMIFAFGLCGGNFGDSICVCWLVRKFCVIGPHFLCGSIAKGSKMVFALSSSWIVVSPRMVLTWVLSCAPESVFLLHRMYFLFSTDCKCLSAMAVK